MVYMVYMVYRPRGRPAARPGPAGAGLLGNAAPPQRQPEAQNIMRSHRGQARAHGET